MCFCKYERVDEEPNYSSVGHLKVALKEEPSNNVQAIVVCSNAKLVSGHETLQHNLGAQAGKASYLEERPVLKPGHVAKIAITAHITVKFIFYVVVPHSDAALKDFFLHKGLVRALQMALKEEGCSKVAIIAPKFGVLELSEDYYTERLANSLKIIGLKSIPGVVFVQVKEKHKKTIEGTLSKKYYDEGECEEW